MAELTVLLAVLAVTAVSVPLADRISLPYPILLLLFGLVLAVVPGVPAFEVPPELILPLVLPPLLYTAARRTSWTELAASWRAIGLLAVALVVVTAFAVGAVLQLLVPGVPWSIALILGAMVGPPDPVAATAVAARLRLPRRMTTILVGEGVSNDATALIMYDVAVAAVVTGSFSAWSAGGLFALSAVVGVAVGLGLAWLSRRILDRLPADPARPALSFVIPFVAYLLADALHGSGVLAVVALALSLARADDQGGALARTQAAALWQVVELLVTGAAFAFVGLELRTVLGELTVDVGTLIAQTAILSAVAIAVRFAWIFPVAWLNERTRLLGGGKADNPTGWKEMAVASWAGMRGVVTLATALALPLTLDNGDDFPERGRLLALAFGVTVVTLLLQGLTLPWLVSRLGVQETTRDRRDAEREVTARAMAAGRDRLEELRRRDDLADDLVDEAVGAAEALLHQLDSHPDTDDESGGAKQKRLTHLVDLEAEMLAAARREVIAIRRERGSDPRVVDEVLARLDARGLQPRVAPED